MPTPVRHTPLSDFSVRRTLSSCLPDRSSTVLTVVIVPSSSLVYSVYLSVQDIFHPFSFLVGIFLVTDPFLRSRFKLKCMLLY